MAVVSGGGPVEDIVADSDGFRGCGGVLPDEQATRISVRATAAGQHNCRFRMAAIVPWVPYYCARHGTDAAPLRAEQAVR